MQNTRTVLASMDFVSKADIDQTPTSIFLNILAKRLVFICYYSFPVTASKTKAKPGHHITAASPVYQQFRNTTKLQEIAADKQNWF